MGVRPVQGTTDTLRPSDNNNVVVYESNSSVTVTVPAGLPTTFRSTLVQLGTGVVTLVEGAGVTLSNEGSSLSTGGQYGTMDLTASAGNAFVVTISSQGGGGGGQPVVGPITATSTQPGPSLTANAFNVIAAPLPASLCYLTLPAATAGTRVDVMLVYDVANPRADTYVEIVGAGSDTVNGQAYGFYELYPNYSYIIPVATFVCFTDGEWLSNAY